MPTATTPKLAADDMLDDLNAATAASDDRSTFRAYMLGALATQLEALPNGRDMWASALETATMLDRRLAPTAQGRAEAYAPPF